MLVGGVWCCEASLPCFAYLVVVMRQYYLAAERQTLPDWNTYEYVLP